MKETSPDLIPWGRAALAGVTGAFAATTFLTFCNLAGWTQLNLPFLIGSIFFPEVGPRAWNTGFVILVAGGIPMAIFYRGFFKWAHHINIGLGLILGFWQWMASGLILGLIEFINPAVPEQVPSPAPYGWAYGIGAFSFFFVANLLYGFFVTAIEQRRRMKVMRFSWREPQARAV